MKILHCGIQILKLGGIWDSINENIPFRKELKWTEAMLLSALICSHEQMTE